MTHRIAPRLLDRSTPPHILTLTLLAGLSALSMNIFLPSLPNMTEYFKTDYHLMQLSISAYLAVNAVLQIIIGPISDRFGRRPVILWSIGLFLLSTVGTLLAGTVEMFLLFRMGQAVIVTGMVLSRAVVRDMVPQDEAASMIGYVTMGMTIVPMVGPAIGGMLDEAFGWHANFAMLLVLGVLIFALVWADLAETAKLQSTSFKAQIKTYPDLLTSRRFWGYVACAAFSSGSFFAFLGGAPFVATEVFGLSPSTMGRYFAFTALGYAIGNFISGRYSVKYGANRMILTGSLVACSGLTVSLVSFLLGANSALLFFGLMSTVGLGNGITLPNANAGILSVRPHLAGTASGLGGAIQIGGGSALAVVAGLLLSPESGAFPLQWIMLSSAVASVLSIFYVMHREKAVGIT